MLNTVHPPLKFVTYLNKTGDGGTIVLNNFDGQVTYKKNEIIMIEVSSALRRKGYGTLLLQNAENNIKKNGWTYVMLTSISAESDQFYLKNGYRRCSIFSILWRRQYIKYF